MMTDQMPTQTQESSLQSLIEIADYQRANQNVFPSEASLRWFIRRNRPGLLESGALVMLCGRWMIHGPNFTERVMEIARDSASRRAQ